MYRVKKKKATCHSVSESKVREPSNAFGRIMAATESDGSSETKRNGITQIPKEI